MARLSGIQRVMEVGMMISCAFSFFLLLSLAYFHPSDPGWSQAGMQIDVQNLMGPVGAYLADILLFTFGVTAYLVPFALAFVGWFIFLHIKSVVELDYLTITLRLVGIILLVFGFTGIASINFDDFYRVSAGGAMGDIISDALLPYFSFVGTVLLLLCFFLTGCTLATGISWFQFIDSIGASVIYTGKMLITLPSKLSTLSLPDLRKSIGKPKDDDFYDSPNQDIHITSLRAEPPAPEKKAPTFTIPAEIFDDLAEPTSTLFTKSNIKANVTQANAARTAAANSDSTQQGRVDALAPRESLLDDESSTANVPLGCEDLSANAKAPVHAEPPLASSESLPVDTPKALLPSFDLLQRADKVENPITPEELQGIARLLEAKLADFNIQATVVDVLPGPVITRFELDLAPGIKVSKITTLAKDLARAMSAISVRVVEVIPGKSVIGLELPNTHREMVRLSEVIGCAAFQDNPSPLTMVLGADISGEPVIVDLASMPHLLVAGTTGSGKSVGVNVMILSLLYKSTPEDVRLIMIDPKMLELSVYEGIPHLLTGVVTDMKEASNALRWCVGEMERRYRLMSALGVRNLKGYNRKVKLAKEAGQPILDPLWKFEESMETRAPELEKLPSIVVIIDEFADMMMIVGKKVEELIARIAQKARAAGIHLILATQRPSVDVITGLIKANIPTRIAFQVSSKIDSRTILDQQGAESLLGMGDMLYNPPGSSITTRVHGAFVDDHEVHAVVADWKARGAPNYIDEILNGDATGDILLPGELAEKNTDEEYDAVYDHALEFVTETRKVSISSIQRKFRIGYNRAARIVEQLEQNGVVSTAGHNGNREVLAPPPRKD
ncbi:DNA translocase ftsK [Glaciecola punicea ACAM 611]|jgi:S-DNA-T family DNA segregation ATPase FtsK/SpoIIIE|uniref:DNA translocase FtsK n=1 Tax=Glaciecola punicea ACAM 611 TaxID=1121923 RepID=H5T9R6_9ALTE|nr:DNA translocase FtsK [Glaciecola punicea]OFA33343.1 cell division protein FtsK [Glaciecola punicea]GAB55043.1 DNA translocase ftsK [Glaciecola punicea ACAM 611]